MQENGSLDDQEKENREVPLPPPVLPDKREVVRFESGATGQSRGPGW